MIRWYDYALAILAADAIITFLIAGFLSSVWWEPALYGLCAGILWQFWSKDYCQFRLKQEIQRGQ
jgi:hypothetical protein